MAVKASATITLSSVIDVKATYRYYLLQSSTLTKPSKPTAYPPSSSWDDTEPTYQNGSTNTLYFVDCTVFSDDTFSYSEVSISSSYEAAKAAWNKAHNAEQMVEVVQNALDVSMDVIIGTQTSSTNSWAGDAKFSELKDGQQIVYWLPYASNGSSVTLKLKLPDGTSTGTKNVYYNGTRRVTNQYTAGNVIRLVYRSSASINGGTYSGWWCDANYEGTDTYDRTKYAQSIKAGAAITSGNIIVGNNGSYTHLKTGDTFDISYPILYAGSSMSSGLTGTNNYIAIPFTVTTTQSITLEAYKPVYIQGTLKDGMFTPVNTTSFLTQTIPTTEDGYHYMLLGNAYSTTGIYLLPEHPIFQYYVDGFKSVEQIAVEAAKTATNYIKIKDEGLIVGNLTNETLGKNVLIDLDSVDIRDGDDVLARYSANAIDLGFNNEDTVINFCNRRASIYFDYNEELNEGYLYLDSTDSIFIGGYYSASMRSVLMDGSCYGESNFIAYKPSTSSSSSVPGIIINTYVQSDNEFRESFMKMMTNSIGIQSTEFTSLSGATADININAVDGVGGIYLMTVDNTDSTSNLSLESGAVLIRADGDVRIYDNEFRPNNELWMQSNVIVPNNKGYYGINTSGATRDLIRWTNSNYAVVGKGGYDYSEGGTSIYGNVIAMYNKNPTGSWKPFFGAGQTTSGTYHGAGYITGSSKKVHMTISLGKPIIGSPTITVTSVNGLVVRQGGNYLYGSSADSYTTKISSINAYREYTTNNSSVVHIVFDMANTTNAGNNVPCGIVASIQIAFT